MVESWWNHGVESHLRRSFCDSTMIPLQIYDSTKTTIIPLVELWWNYRGGITKIVSESVTRVHNTRRRYHGVESTRLPQTPSIPSLCSHSPGRCARHLALRPTHHFCSGAISTSPRHRYSMPAALERALLLLHSGSYPSYCVPLCLMLRVPLYHDPCRPHFSHW